VIKSVETLATGETAELLCWLFSLANADKWSFKGAD
jgi:hypothetical protein